MYKIYLFRIPIAAVLTTHSAFAQKKIFSYREWEDERVVHINLEKPHATFTAYQIINDVLKDDFSNQTSTNC